MISITIPIYNEKDNILTLYVRVKEALEILKFNYEIIMVNDGSSDGSDKILDEIAIKDNKVKVIHFNRNYGQTSAMVAGLDMAKGDIIIPIDGDLQNDPDDIGKLVDKLNEGFDVVSGWRKNRKDSRIKRNFVSAVANKFISYVSGVHLHDYGCTLKAYKKNVVKNVKLYGEMHRFIPIYASWCGARVTEVEVNHFPRIHGKSKYGLERVVKVIFDLIVVQFLHKYSTKPMYVFGSFGMLCFLFCFLSGLTALYLKFFQSIYLIQTPLPLLSVMTFITGIMCVLMGLLAELSIRIYYESQSRSVYVIDRTKNF